MQLCRTNKSRNKPLDCIFTIIITTTLLYHSATLSKATVKLEALLVICAKQMLGENRGWRHNEGI